MLCVAFDNIVCLIRFQLGDMMIQNVSFDLVQLGLDRCAGGVTYGDMFLLKRRRTHTSENDLQDTTQTFRLDVDVKYTLFAPVCASQRWHFNNITLHTDSSADDEDKLIQVRNLFRLDSRLRDLITGRTNVPAN